MFAGSGKLDDGASSPNGTAGGDRAAAPGVPAEPTPIQKLAEAAKNGDIRAQHDLGLIYVQGNGVPKDPKKGAILLEQSAGAGLPKAQYHVGVLYEKGLGVPRNVQTAFLWYQRAAMQGHVRAQHNLGTFYAEGKGTAQNYAEAARWFSRASRGGLAESHYSLGMIHEHGLGVEKDDRKAAAFYRSALAAGSAQAAAKLARIEPALKETSKQVEETLAARVATTENDSAAAAKGRTLSPAGIVDLQRLLARLDLAPGPPNGVLGEQTVEAIKLYQRFAGLPVDGKPSVELLRDLRQVVGAMDTDSPTAAAKPPSP
jgi:localization factor PodJL